MKKSEDRLLIKEEDKGFNEYELINGYRQGDEEALNTLIQKFKRVSYLYIDRYFNSFPRELDRHEMYQISIVSLYNAILTYDEEKENSFTTYFSVILNHDLLMYIRRIKKVANRSNLNTFSLDAEVRETEGVYFVESMKNEREEFEPDGYLSLKEMHAEIKKQLMNFSEQERYVFILWMQGYTYREIGEAVKMNRKKIEYVLHKVRDRLKISLGDWK